MMMMVVVTMTYLMCSYTCWAGKENFLILCTYWLSGRAGREDVCLAQGHGIRTEHSGILSYHHFYA